MTYPIHFFLALLVAAGLLASCTSGVQSVSSPSPEAAAPAQTTAAAPVDAQTYIVTIPSDLRGTIPLHVYVPDRAEGDLPVILFSTGAFSSPEKYEALLKPWAKAGYAVIAPLHVDAERWTGARPTNPADGLMWRRLDMIAAIEATETIELAIGKDLAIKEVAAAGHSFGGLVAQNLGGAQPGPVAGPLSRVTPMAVSAVIAISPPGPIPDYIEAPGWARMTAPQLLTTGDADIVPNIAPQWQAHLAGHKAHEGQSWALVQGGVDHYFGNIIGRTEYPGPPQQTQFAGMLETTLQFLDAYLKDNQEVRSRLEAIAIKEASAYGLKRR